MEENKYYTPEISEFFVGFEYETIYLKSVWTKEVLNPMDCGWFFESYINDAVEVEFRVKYLDKEDIEEVLKVKQLKGDEVELNFQVWKDDSNDFYEIDYDTDTNMLIIEKFIETRVNNYNSFTLFRGKVKNKSELQKLLKQLGI
jgi:hypothetical protein